MEVENKAEPTNELQGTDSVSPMDEDTNQEFVPLAAKLATVVSDPPLDQAFPSFPAMTAHHKASMVVLDSLRLIKESLNFIIDWNQTTHNLRCSLCFSLTEPNGTTESVGALNMISHLKKVGQSQQLVISQLFGVMDQYLTNPDSKPFDLESYWIQIKSTLTERNQLVTLAEINNNEGIERFNSFVKKIAMNPQCFDGLKTTETPLGSSNNGNTDPKAPSLTKANPATVTQIKFPTDVSTFVLPFTEQSTKDSKPSFIPKRTRRATKEPGSNNIIEELILGGNHDRSRPARPPSSHPSPTDKSTLRTSRDHSEPNSPREIPTPAIDLSHELLANQLNEKKRVARKDGLASSEPVSQEDVKEPEAPVERIVGFKQIMELEEDLSAEFSNEEPTLASKAPSSGVKTRSKTRDEKETKRGREDAEPTNGQPKRQKKDGPERKPTDALEVTAAYARGLPVTAGALPSFLETIDPRELAKIRMARGHAQAQAQAAAAQSGHPYGYPASRLSQSQELLIREQQLRAHELQILREQQARRPLTPEEIQYLEQQSQAQEIQLLREQQIRTHELQMLREQQSRAHMQTQELQMLREQSRQQALAVAVRDRQLLQARASPMSPQPPMSPREYQYLQQAAAARASHPATPVSPAIQMHAHGSHPNSPHPHSPHPATPPAQHQVTLIPQHALIHPNHPGHAITHHPNRFARPYHVAYQ